MSKPANANRIATLQARREALLARIERERVAFSHALGAVAPLLRLGDRVGALVNNLRAQPLVLGAGFLGRALLRNSRAGRWWRRGRMVSALLAPVLRRLRGG